MSYNGIQLDLEKNFSSQNINASSSWPSVLYKSCPEVRFLVDSSIKKKIKKTDWEALFRPRNSISWTRLDDLNKYCMHTGAVPNQNNPLPDAPNMCPPDIITQLKELYKY